MTRKSTRGGIGDWISPYDQYDSVPSKSPGRFWKTQSFATPKYSPWARRITSLANRVFYFRLGGLRHGTVIPILPESELTKLKAIPRGAGNILVGPHPGPLDAYLMSYLLDAAHHGPAVFLMAAEVYFGGTALRRFLLRRLGVIPVARGRKNPEAVQVMSEFIARGWWGGIFPEGEVYFSRQVMPMEYGMVRIAVEAALKIQRKADERGQNKNEHRPVFLTPFGHVYFLKDPKDAMRRVRNALRDLESHPMVAIKHPTGDLPTRLRRAADQLLENKADVYRIPGEEWHHDDRFERTRRLQDAVISRLEKEYFGRIERGYVRRRATRVRTACFERLADGGLSEEARQKIEEDIQKTREVILMTPFSQAYREKYNDLETWVEYLCRIRSALGMSPFNFGSQVVDFKVQTPIDVHPIATEYRSLDSEENRIAYLYKKTELVRELVQASVDEICSAHKTMRIPEASDSLGNRLSL